MTVNKLGSGESKLETGISYLLIIGVIISLLLEVAGIIVLYLTYGNLDISRDAGMFIQGKGFFSFIYEQFQGGRQSGTAVLLMTAGIIVLILTPYARLVTSVFYFGWERNFRYVAITLFVLVVVTVSLILH